MSPHSDEYQFVRQSVKENAENIDHLKLFFWTRLEKIY